MKIGRPKTNFECKIEGCNKPAKAKELCARHYNRIRSGVKDMRLEKLSLKWKPDDVRYHRKTKICKIENCKKKHYAKGLCHNHYGLNRRNGSPIYLRDIPKPKCSVSGCNNITTSHKSRYCRFHLNRKRKGIPLNRPKGVKGRLNFNWNNGASEYPNHYLMKKNRKIVLEKADYKCFYCGRFADRVHHLDKSKDNHSINNLVASCNSCNLSMSKLRTSKYKRIFGKTLKELAEQYQTSIWIISRRAKDGILYPLVKDEIRAVLW